jgi:hypothetical protein
MTCVSGRPAKVPPSNPLRRAAVALEKPHGPCQDTILLVMWSLRMDSSFLKEQADRCRRLAENADQFTKRRLLDLAEGYEDRLGRPSRASRNLGIPASLLEARLQDTRNGSSARTNDA